MPATPLEGAPSGSGPGVVLLHPVGLDRSFWGALPGRLAASRRVLALDLRGHGGSPPSEPGLTIEDYADNVLVTMEQHGLGPSYVIGLSFGGMVAQTLALRHRASVAGLVLCGCPGAIPADARPALRRRGLAAEEGGMAAVVQETIERWFTPPFRTDARVERVRSRLESDRPADWSAAWHAISGFEALPHLHTLQIPALVIAGEHDAATAPAASKALAEAIPGARLTVLPGASHMMQIENEPEFAAAVLDFVANPSRRP